MSKTRIVTVVAILMPLWSCAGSECSLNELPVPVVIDFRNGDIGPHEFTSRYVSTFQFESDQTTGLLLSTTVTVHKPREGANLVKVIVDVPPLLRGKWQITDIVSGFAGDPWSTFPPGEDERTDTRPFWESVVGSTTTPRIVENTRFTFKMELRPLDPTIDVTAVMNQLQDEPNWWKGPTPVAVK